MLLNLNIKIIYKSDMIIIIVFCPIIFNNGVKLSSAN